MPNLNKVMLMGNLTRDPELRYTQNNTPIANLGLAVNRRWKNQAGEQQEETTFIDCDAWGRTAEVLNQYLKKGRPVYLEGRLKLDQWQDQQGNNRSKLKVVVESFQFIDSGQREDGDARQQRQQSSGRSASRHVEARSLGSSLVSTSQSGGYDAIEEDDIPF